MSIESQILQILSKTSEVRLNDLVEETGASRQMVHRVLKNLIENRRVLKIGSAPKTYYKLRGESTDNVSGALHPEHEEFLNEHFLLITEIGTKLSGIEALHHWCIRQKLPFDKTAKEFIATRRKYLHYFLPNSLISGMEKLKSTKGFQKIGMDELFYLDFYAIERFGKTRLGTLLHFAKQGQNKKLMDEIVAMIKERVYQLVADLKMEAVGYIPPTVKREIQFMKVLARKLNLPLPHLDLVKVKGEVAVPQKGLSKIEDRISNAQFSIMIQEQRKFGKILLIDDAVGSGATMNETALKLKTRKIAITVVGLAVTGSFKGFEVIQDV